MANASNYFRDHLPELYFGSSTPANLYLRLYTAAPTATGTGGTEVSGGAYAASQITNDPANFPPAAAGVIANGVEIAFPESTAAWGTLTHFALWDAATLGNMSVSAALADPIVVGTGTVVRFPIGSLTVTTS